MRRSLRFAAALAAAAAALAVPCRAEGATSAGSFRLAPGHAARPAFYFVVTSPGAAGVRVETSVPEPVTITIYAGTNAVRRTQGEKDIRLTVNATLELLATGHEWAVVVSGSAASTVGDGRITVESPASASGGSPSHPLDIWLQQHPAVAFHPTWNDRGRVASYSAWPNGMRDALRKAFDDGRAGRPPGGHRSASQRVVASARRRPKRHSHRVRAGCGASVISRDRRALAAGGDRPSCPVVARRFQR